MSRLKNYNKFKLNQKSIFALKFFLKLPFIGLVFSYLKIGHNQNIDIAFNKYEIYILPPLSGSSSAIKKLSMEGYTVSQVRLEKLYKFASEFDLIFYIWREDEERLISFYKKKLLNPNSIKKFFIYLGHKEFLNIKNFSDFCTVLKEKNILSDPKRDKHLFLNNDIVLNIDLAKTEFIDMEKFLVGARKLNSSRDLLIKEEISNSHKKKLVQVLIDHNLANMNFVDAIVVSSRKSGSTYVDRKLRLQTKVSLPCKIKETQFFADNFTKGIKWYKNQFLLTTDKLRVDVCPTYGMNKLALQRIKLTNPSAVIIMLVRHPYERAKSHYMHLKRNRWVRVNENLVKKFPEILDDSDYKRIYENIIAAGFPSDRIHIIDIDDKANFDFQIEDLFMKKFNLMFNTSKKITQQNVRFTVRFKGLYLIARKTNFELNKLGIKFPSYFKSYILKTFKKLETETDKEMKLYLSDYEGFFKEQSNFINKIKEVKV